MSNVYANYNSPPEDKDSEYEEPIYRNPRAGPPRIRSQPPDTGETAPPSGRSTPDLLEKVKGIFNADPAKQSANHAAAAAKTRENLAQSYQYFKDKHSKADDQDARNKVLNAAHRHYQKSKKSHKKFSDIVEAAYLDFLESVRSEDLAGGCGECDEDTKKADNLADEYRFFVDQYNRAEDEVDREAANAAAHRYFTLQYQSCQDEIERAMSSEAYEDFLESRHIAGTSSGSSGSGLPASIHHQFQIHLQNFRAARTEEQRVAAMESAHRFFMGLTGSCKTEAELQQLASTYQEFLAVQKESLQESKQKSMSTGRQSKSEHSKSSKGEKKVTTTTTTRAVIPEEELWRLQINGDKHPPPMTNPTYYIRWLYLCLFLQLLFVIGILLIFMFGAFAGCWLRYTETGLIVLILLWVLLVILIVVLGLFAPKRQTFPYSVLWLVVLTVLLSVCISLAALYFDTVIFLVVLLGLLTVFLLVFVFTLLPVGYSTSRLLFATILSWIICLVAVLIFLSIVGIPFSALWIISLVIILAISLWVAIDASLVVDNKFHTAGHDEWMFGAVCCYSDPFIVFIHLCYLPFAPTTSTSK